jgi:hypothetical protein
MPTRDCPIIEETPLKVYIFFDNEDGTRRYFATDQVETICSNCLRIFFWTKMMLS